MEKSAVLPVDIENLDMEAAARVAQQFVLQEIFLVDAKISRDPLIESPEALSLEHKCSTESLSSDKDKKLVSILCNFRVAAFNGEESSKLVMKIEASFCTSYSYVSKPDIHIPDDVDSILTHLELDEIDSILTHLEYMMTINPISNAWPYWREFVQSMSTRMGFPALTVPLLEIVPKKPAAKEAKRQPAKRKPTQRKKLSV
jgi:hypothetical protein